MHVLQSLRRKITLQVSQYAYDYVHTYLVVLLCMYSVGTE